MFFPPGLDVKDVANRPLTGLMGWIPLDEGVTAEKNHCRRYQWRDASRSIIIEE